MVPTFVLFLAVACVGAQEGQASEQGASPEAEGEAQAKEDSFNPLDHTNWGSYYDPQNIFCGKYDCYAILGFDYEEFGSIRPSTKEITKRYRSLSRAWHPDKSKHKDAKERFVVRIFHDNNGNAFVILLLSVHWVLKQSHVIFSCRKLLAPTKF